MRRPDWDEIGMGFAAQIATRSKCVTRSVGAAVSSADYRSWAFGYNGAPAGLVSPGGQNCRNFCPQGQGISDECYAIHAEINCLGQSSRREREGGTFYVTAAPCLKCALAIANSGVSRLVCPAWEPERLELALTVIDVLYRCDIDLVGWSL